METVTESTASLTATTITTSQLEEASRAHYHSSSHYQTRSRSLSHTPLALNHNTSPIVNTTNKLLSISNTTDQSSDESNDHFEETNENDKKHSYQSEADECALKATSLLSTPSTSDTSTLSLAVPITSSFLSLQKNKRKNFNPRFSANDEQTATSTATTTTLPDSADTKTNSTIENSVSDNNKVNSIILNKDVIMENAIKIDQSDNSDMTATDHNPIASEAMSINWRKVLTENLLGVQPSQQQPPSTGHQTDNENAIDSKNLQTQTNENANFFNIPNTNFSIGKMPTSSIGSIDPFSVSGSSSSDKMSESIAGLHSSALENATSQLEQARSILNHHQQQVRQHQQQQQQDPQSKLEFACNAFNAVQELLNVYGLSISPNDIVDAFKKQAAAATIATTSKGKFLKDICFFLK